MVGLEKVESFLKLKEVKFMMKDIITKNNKQQMQKNSNEKHVLLCSNIKFEESCIIDIDSKFGESELIKIFVEDEIDCSNFVQNVEPNKNLIFEDSIDFKNLLRIMELRKKRLWFSKSSTYSKSSFCYKRT